MGEVVSFGIGAEFHCDVGSVEHLPNHCGVAFERNALVSVLEVAVVSGEINRNAGGDGTVDLGGILSPLLLCVMEEDVLVDVLGEEAEIFVVLFHEVLDGDLGAVLEFGEELLLDPVGKCFWKSHLDGVEVEGDGEFVAFDDRYDSVHVCVESGELPEELPDILLGGVEDVRSILVDHYSVFVAVVVAVACDVVETVDDGYLGVFLRRISVGDDSTGDSCADDQNFLHNSRYKYRGFNSEWARPDLNRGQELPKLQGYQATPRALLTPDSFISIKCVV